MIFKQKAILQNIKWIFLCSIVFGLLSCTSQKKEICLDFKVINDNETIEINNKKKINGYLLKTEIRNNTDTTLKFWIMSDSWYDNFGYNDHFQFFEKNSDKSIPELIEIKSNESKLFVSKLVVSDSIKTSKGKQIKAGFVLIFEHEYEFLNHKASIHELILAKQKKNQDLIWGLIDLD